MNARLGFAALVGAAALSALCGCGGAGGSTGAGGPPTRATPTPTPLPVPQLPQHVVVIVQENRSFDNLFMGFPGADTQNWALDHTGKRVPLVPVALDAPFDVFHDHSAFVTEYDGGKMDGFDEIRTACTQHGHCPVQTPYSYVFSGDVKPYWNLAEQFGLADEMLQSNEGSSFAAHQYLIAGQSGHPWAMSGIPSIGAGCDSPYARVAQIDMQSPYPGVEGNVASPCKNYPTVLDELINKGLSWRYYAPFAASLYNAPFAISHIYFGPTAKDDVTPDSQILTDIQSHSLATVSYLVSRLALTDHPGFTSPNGPYWIATLTNAIFTDPYYLDNTVVFITWDDWGGLYDHVPARHPAGLPTDPYEYGFRVPLIVVSPFVRSRHLVDHTARDQTAILHFIESTFGLPSLGQLDAKTDDLSGMFDFLGKPLPYARVDTGGFTPSDLMRYPAEQGAD